MPAPWTGNRIRQGGYRNLESTLLAPVPLPTVREVIFTMPGSVTTDLSPPYHVFATNGGGNLFIQAVMGTAPTADLSVYILQNGIVIGSVTVTAGTTSANTTILASLAVGDLLQAQCGSADGADLTVQVVWQ